MSLLLTFAVLTLLAVTLGVLLLTLVHRRRTQSIVELDLLGDDPPGTEDVRVLRRQVAVLTSALGEWEAEVAQVPDLRPFPYVHAVASWTSLSRDLAARGQVERSAMALWAADLHVLAPHLVEREAELVARLEELPTDTALNTLRRAREIALSLVADAAGPVTAMLAPADHVSPPGTPGEVPSRESGGRRTTTAADPDALLAVADHWRGRARVAAASGQLGLEGREAEMAAFEAALVDSAHHHGDTRLTSVGLRADLARVVVGGLPRPEPGGDPATDEQRVRSILLQLLPHHEQQRHDALVTARISR
ncbi:MAG: hypothetical protein Q8O61_12105 [Nocardioides sp.]|nr:hypothetical protein [Nocardioides sp.]